MLVARTSLQHNNRTACGGVVRGVARSGGDRCTIAHTAPRLARRTSEVARCHLTSQFTRDVICNEEDVIGCVHPRQNLAAGARKERHGSALLGTCDSPVQLGGRDRGATLQDKTIKYT